MESLPSEVAQIAQNVSEQKRNEVQTVLNQVFEGVSKMRQQLNSIVVANEKDETAMKMASTIRLAVKRTRLDAEKVFDAKRAEVQSQMLHFQTEDKLWLKAKQTMQILTKEIEESAKWKEETRQRFEAEQKELKVQQRMMQVAKFSTEITRAEFEHMSDESFELFIAGIEKQHNEWLESQRKAEEERIAREKAEAEERERIRKENERLKAEAEERERQLAEERAKAEKEKAKAEAERKAIEEKARKEREAAERIAAEERAKQEAILKAEREAKAKVEAELRAKEQAELKARQGKMPKRPLKKAAAAPDKVKLMLLAMQIDEMELPEIKSEDAAKILSDVKNLLGKVSKFIREKADNL